MKISTLLRYQGFFRVLEALNEFTAFKLTLKHTTITFLDIIEDILTFFFYGASKDELCGVGMILNIKKE